MEPTTSDQSSGPLGELLYVAGGREVLAIDRATGQQIWRQIWRQKLVKSFLSSSSIAMMTVRGGELYVALDGTIHCLDRFTGATLWTCEAPKSSMGNMLLTVGRDDLDQRAMGAEDDAAMMTAAQAASSAAATAAE
jgi:outer membrane protein assembly factor BamB